LENIIFTIFKEVVTWTDESLEPERDYTLMTHHTYGDKHDAYQIALGLRNRDFKEMAEDLPDHLCITRSDVADHHLHITDDACFITEVIEYSSGVRKRIGYGVERSTYPVL